MDPFARRRAGLLLHLASLPGPGPVGTLGPEAHRFLELLAGAGQTVWQMLPVGPTHADGSPYQCLSDHAGNPAFLDPRPLAEAGWLRPEEAGPGFLERAWEGFRHRAGPEDLAAWEAFRVAEGWWLEDYALFMALREAQGGRPWWEWPEPLRRREPGALERSRGELAEALERRRFEQFLFHRQWEALRAAARSRGILLFGDLPVFVAHDSVEAWTRPELFKLDAEGRPEVVAGVPPDYFSATGQRWGNPVYRWEALAAEGYRWWIRRLESQLRRFDLVRIDHFRGFEACWEIPAHEPTAQAGRWVPGPGDALFEALERHLLQRGPGGGAGRGGRLPVVAEDLGLVTPEVEALRRRHGLPGMKVLQFAFGGGADNPYLPHRHEPEAVVYTGTHDNDTTLAWYETLGPAARAHLEAYLPEARPGAGLPMPWPLIRAALASVAVLAVLPVQDVAGLGAGHRLNRPGTRVGNWRWRLRWEWLGEEALRRLRELTELYGRA